MAKVLVTGGCGYIGSHTVIDLLSKGHQAVSVDNLINSSGEALERIRKVTGTAVVNHEIDLQDGGSLMRLFESESFDAIIHFAALKSVGDSVNNPLRYYENNLVGMLNLLACQQKFSVSNFIFSSSCSVYGNAEVLPVTEATPIAEAESPYARTKQFCEEIIFDLSKKDQHSSFIVLRYFNPAGAHPTILIGEDSLTPASNLVPVVTETGIGKREQLKIFGSDYPTRDGTCVRDYIHIMDLADAHTRSLEYLMKEKTKEKVQIFNLGSGSGSTVLEVVRAFEKASGKDLNYALVDRRAGDVVAIFADYTKAKNTLGWEPKRGIEEIMKSAWLWELARSNSN